MFEGKGHIKMDSNGEKLHRLMADMKVVILT